MLSVVGEGEAGLLVSSRIMSHSDRMVRKVPHQRVADTLVPVCIANSRSRYVVVVGAGSVME